MIILSLYPSEGLPSQLVLVAHAETSRAESRTSRKSVNVLRSRSENRCLPGCLICPMSQQFARILYLNRSCSGVVGTLETNLLSVWIESCPSRCKLMWRCGSALFCSCSSCSATLTTWFKLSARRFPSESISSKASAYDCVGRTVSCRCSPCFCLKAAKSWFQSAQGHNNVM